MPIEMKHIKKSYGNQVVLEDFSLTIPDGGTVCLMGASGAGKTTILRILAGLTKPDEGEVVGVQGGKASMVFQEDRLLEWLDAFANVELVLGRISGGTYPAGQGIGRSAGMSDTKKSKSAKVALRDFLRLEFEAVGLCGYEGKPVSQLSGGMKRRVAIVRAICSQGGLLLLDEPFTGLDEVTKGQAIRYIKERTKGRTVVMVTHDAKDAAHLGAEIIRCGGLGNLRRMG